MASNMKCAWAAAAALLAACGCVSVKGDRTLVPPTGLYAHFRAPLSVNRVSVPCENLKTGKASENLYIWAWPLVFFPFNASFCDMALQSAIEDGGLTKVYFADYHQDSFFGLVTRFTVTAYGE